MFYKKPIAIIFFFDLGWESCMERPHCKTVCFEYINVDKHVNDSSVINIM